MSIEQICNSITRMFDNVRPPFPQLSRILLVCSMIRRPGLSTIQSAANIIKDLNSLGIPTGAMPDGSPNLTAAFIFANTKEIYRGIRKDMSIQVGIQPGTMSTIGYGANAGGPVTVVSTNTTPSMGYGMAN